MKKFFGRRGCGESEKEIEHLLGRRRSGDTEMPDNLYVQLSLYTFFEMNSLNVARDRSTCSSV